jgi:hypothetical protein
MLFREVQVVYRREAELLYHWYDNLGRLTRLPLSDLA